jgi:rhamnose utilization protein RhaD (predicted bifunctional aldolase and dehydrogenase)
MDDRLMKLILLSHQLADPSLDLVIIGEGNTSTSCNDGTFWVKASGCQLATIGEEGFSHVNADVIFELIAKDHLTDVEIEKGLLNSLLDQNMKKPSVETFLHALFLYKANIQWVAHTHPASVMSILCSVNGAKPFTQHLFPDEIVVCGEMPMVVPYVDPGLSLAHTVRDILYEYLDAYGTAPKLVLMENHGIVALGSNPDEALNISIMAEKWARTIIGTYIMGGPRYLTPDQAKRIETRPDEAYRRKQILS